MIPSLGDDLLDVNSCGVLLGSSDGKIIMSSRQFEEVSGYTKDEIQEACLEKIISKGDLAAVGSLLKRRGKGAIEIKNVWRLP